MEHGKSSGFASSINILPDRLFFYHNLIFSRVSLLFLTFLPGYTSPFSVCHFLAFSPFPGSLQTPHLTVSIIFFCVFFCRFFPLSRLCEMGRIYTPVQSYTSLINWQFIFPIEKRNRFNLHFIQ